MEYEYSGFGRIQTEKLALNAKQKSLPGYIPGAGILKLASSSYLVRALGALTKQVANLQKSGKPVSKELMDQIALYKKTLADKTDYSMKRLNYKLNKSLDSTDVSNKFNRIGKKYSLNDRLNTLNTAAQKPVTDVTGARGFLDDWGKDFAEIRKTIPREYWASNKQIADYRQYARNVGREQGWSKGDVPGNVHRSLFHKATNQPGSRVQGVYTVTNPRTGQSINPYRDVSGASRSRIDLFPVDDEVLALNKSMFAPGTGLRGMSDDAARNLIGRNTLWHEGGHMLDPRFRKSFNMNTGRTQLDLNDITTRGRAENWATAHGNFGMMRPQAKPVPTIQEYGSTLQREYPVNMFGAPTINTQYTQQPGTSMFGATQRAVNDAYGAKPGTGYFSNGAFGW